MLSFIFTVIIFGAFIIIILSFRESYLSNGKTLDNGKAVKWQIGGIDKTEIISNKRLAALQRMENEGGNLHPNDLIIVWAEEFLDDEILFEPVCNNVANGVHYLYLLDELHINRFRALLDKLNKKLERPEIVNNGVNVIFLKSELTLNNYVMMAAGSRDQKLYSALLYERQAFAWMEQSNYRSNLFRLKVKRIVARMAVSQYFQRDEAHGEIPMTHRERISMYPLDNEHQIMNFDGLGEKIAKSEGGADAVDDFQYDLRDVVASTQMPDDSYEKMHRMAARTAEA